MNFEAENKPLFFNHSEDEKGTYFPATEINDSHFSITGNFELNKFNIQCFNSNNFTITLTSSVSWKFNRNRK